jgi:hypothetical protein
MGLVLFDRIFSAYQGKYNPVELALAPGKDRSGSMIAKEGNNETDFDDVSISFEEGRPGVVGRAFIEVG